MRDEIAFLAGPRDWGLTREKWLERAANKVPSVTYRTVKAIWYREIKDENHWAAREIKRAYQIQKASQQAADLAKQLQTMANGLDVIDPAFHEHEIATLLGAIRDLSSKNRT